MLELLDYLAVEVSNKFCNLDIFKGSKNIVTVCVDHVQFFKELQVNYDLTIDSYVTFAGNSTLEIRIDIL